MKRLIAIVLLCFLAPYAYGETITHVFDDGTKYVGEVKNGKMHGQGTLTYSNGNKYVGELRDNQFHGHGTYAMAGGDEIVGNSKKIKRMVMAPSSVKVEPNTSENGIMVEFMVTASTHGPMGASMSVNSRITESGPEYITPPMELFLELTLTVNGFPNNQPDIAEKAERFTVKGAKA